MKWWHWNGVDVWRELLLFTELLEGADQAQSGDIIDTEEGTYQIIDEPSTSYNSDDESSGPGILQFGILGVVLVAIAGGFILFRRKLKGGDLDGVQEVRFCIWPHSFHASCILQPMLFFLIRQVSRQIP